jgi:dienelactone hydrolase
VTRSGGSARRRFPRWQRWPLIAAGALVLLGIVAVGGNTIGRYGGWTIAGQSATEVAEMLRPAYRVMKPEGSGPFPTALLYSGCDGPHDNLDRWGGMLNARGWAALIIDSHGPRGYLDYDVWRLICAGQLFMGSERASDVLVSIYDARRMPFVDRDRLVLIGSSHGGWAVMELFAFEAASQLPFGLTGLPEDMVEKTLDGVIGTILVYPYCGPGNRSRRSGWSHPAPVLFLLSGNDLIAPAEQCLDLAKTLSRRGIPVETLVFDEVTHGFDQVERAPFSAFKFDAAATRQALEAGGEFLDRIVPPGAPGTANAAEP